MKRVGVVGLGYVGLTLAVALARRGCTVYGCDRVPAVVGARRRKAAPVRAGHRGSGCASCSTTAHARRRHLAGQRRSTRSSSACRRPSTTRRTIPISKGSAAAARAVARARRSEHWWSCAARSRSAPAGRWCFRSSSRCGAARVWRCARSAPSRARRCASWRSCLRWSAGLDAASSEQAELLSRSGAAHRPGVVARSGGSREARSTTATPTSSTPTATRSRSSPNGSRSIRWS